MTRSLLPRRRILHGGVAFLTTVTAFGILRGAGGETLPPTPRQTAGPFYPQKFPADSDNDLVHVAGHDKPALGTVTQVTGRVLDANGRPLRGVEVEIWQADVNGRYHDPRDTHAGPGPDENFQGYGKTVTDAGGGYRFLTIRPVAYPGRTPHIHFAVTGGGIRAPFVTQMYVAGEAQNDRDPVLREIRDPAARSRVIVPLRPAHDVAADALAGNFDIVIGGA
jgi:protocatechuate 3,4-dioxygenase beta subunit